MQAARMASNQAAALAAGRRGDPLAQAVIELATAILALNLALAHLMEPEVEVKANADYKN